MAQSSVASIVLRTVMNLFARSIQPTNRYPPTTFVARKSTPKTHVSRLLCLLAVLLPLSSCVIPVQTGETILEGRYVQEAELQSIKHQGSTRLQVEQQLGPPTAWFERQRILVYGLIRSDSAAVWVIPGFPASTGGYLEFVEREAIFFAINAEDSVVHAGRRSVPRGTTWLEAALEWSRGAGLTVPVPRSEFFAESVEPAESLIVIYRPRDNQYVLPFSPPMERLLFNFDFFAEVYVDSVLIAQLRTKTYLSVRVSPGSHTLLVTPFADHNPMIEYRSARIDIESRPGTTQFIDLRMEAGKGYIGPVIEERPAETAIPALAGLVETW